MDSFSSNFYNKIIHIYSFFGVAPRKTTRKCSLNNNTEIVSKRELIKRWWSVVLFLICYWTALLVVIARKSSTQDVISTISNYLQSVLNGVALTVCVVSSTQLSQEFFEMLTKFDTINGHLKNIGCQINYKMMCRRVNISFIIILSTVLIKSSIEIYVYFIRYDMLSIPYWLLHLLPVVVYFMSVHQGIVFIYWLFICCEMVKNLFEEIEKIEIKSTKISITSLQEVNVPVQFSIHDPQKLLKIAYQVIENISEICNIFNKFIGLSLLVILTTLFTVTSIQAFYCYVIWTDLNEALNRSWWTFWVSLNKVLINLMGVISLCHMSQLLTNKIHEINNCMRKLNDKLTINGNNYLNFVLENIKISAFGFFNINYTMLGGFLSALVTYILIMVQCNEIAGDSKKATVVEEIIF